MPSTTIQDLVRDFHIKFGHLVDQSYADVDGDLLEFRYDLITEEVEELGEALTDGNLPEVAKELGDLVYVAYGFAETIGIDLDAVIREVHKSNMTKTANGFNKPTKGKDFTKPRLGGILGK